MKINILRLTLVIFLLSGCGLSAQTSDSISRIDPGIDPATWAMIPAGEFFSGPNNHIILIDNDYEMMVTSVTNEQYAAYLNKALADDSIKIKNNEIQGYYPGDVFRGYRHEEEILAGNYIHMPLDDPGLRIAFDGQTFTVKTNYFNHPVVLVSWFGAKAYCDYFGWRLPSEMEWEKATRGSDDRPFPWGHDIYAENANYYSSHDIFEKTFGGAGNTTPVGFFNGMSYDGFQTIDSTSPYGLYDMAGNVWEWTSNVYPNQHYRYMRGGSKENYAYNLRVWTRNSAGPTYYSPNVGFRCAKD